MKKILFIFLICFMPHQVFGFEDYLIMSEIPVNSVSSSDESIVSASPFFTIDNSKNSILLKAKKVGNAILTIETEDGDKVLSVSVTDNKTVLQDISGFSYFSLDVPKGGK